VQVSYLEKLGHDVYFIIMLIFSIFSLYLIIKNERKIKSQLLSRRKARLFLPLI